MFPSRSAGLRAAAQRHLDLAVQFATLGEYGLDGPLEGSTPDDEWACGKRAARRHDPPRGRQPAQAPPRVRLAHEKLPAR